MKRYYGGPIETQKRSFERYRPRPPTASSSSRLGVRNPHPKLQSLLSQERVKQRTLNRLWPLHSEGPFEQKPIKNFGEKGAWGIQGLPKVFKYPLLFQERVKLRISNFVRTFTGSIETKAH